MCVCRSVDSGVNVSRVVCLFDASVLPIDGSGVSKPQLSAFLSVCASALPRVQRHSD